MNAAGPDDEGLRVTSASSLWPALRRVLRSPWTWLLAALAVGAALSLTQGLTNWWDLINYHVHNPWALFHHREDIDLFSAGIQGYFDPLLDIPYYLVAYVWLPDHPYIIATLTGLPFGLLIFVSLLLARRVLAGPAGRGTAIRTLVVLATVAMAVSGTATWSQAFTITNEVLVSAIVLGALVLLIDAFGEAPPKLSLRRTLAIGALLGLAAGLKLTALAYAPAGGLLLLAACRDRRSALRNGAVFFAGWLVVFAISYGPWAAHLYARTGNPFFPMFNNVFQSPLAAAGSGSDTRFLPENLWEWLFYPFYWLSDRAQTVFPLPFRDARFALAYALGLATAVLAVATRRHGAGDDTTRPFGLLALLAFWFIAYATWLPLFSMLRYAIVLEVSGSILAAGALLYLMGRLVPQLPGIARIVLVGVLAAATIAYTRTPDLGHIPLQAPVFRSEVPNLGARPLVILANQPMGLLAPLIQRVQPDASFIGIPSCFTPGQWCYTGFYDYGLGRRMRVKIALHQGPMYVAYYADRIPALPQLDSFHISFDAGHCQAMHTNRTPDVMLCPARYVPDAPARPRSARQFHFAAQTERLNYRFTLASRWLQNPCGDTTQPGQVVFDWNAPSGIDGVRVYVVTPPSSQLKPFAGGAAHDKAETGPWVGAAQTFVFTDTSGHVLARSSIRYVPCGPDQ